MAFDLMRGRQEIPNLKVFLGVLPMFFCEDIFRTPLISYIAKTDIFRRKS